LVSGLNVNVKVFSSVTPGTVGSEDEPLLPLPLGASR